MCSSSEAISSEDRIKGMESALEAYGAEHFRVEDTSGGCGAFYNIFVVAPQFQGMPLVKRQREVHKILHDFIKDVHGVTLRYREAAPPSTRAPSSLTPPTPPPRPPLS